MLPFYNPKLTNRIEICFHAMFAIERNINGLIVPKRYVRTLSEGGNNHEMDSRKLNLLIEQIDRFLDEQHKAVGHKDQPNLRTLCRERLGQITA